MNRILYLLFILIIPLFFIGCWGKKKSPNPDEIPTDVITTVSTDSSSTTPAEQFYELGESVEDILKDAENLIEIDQNKEALQLLKSIEPENNIQIAEQLYLLGRLYFALGKFGKADEFYMDANLLNPTEPQYKVGLSQTSYA